MNACARMLGYYTEQWYHFAHLRLKTKPDTETEQKQYAVTAYRHIVADDVPLQCIRIE